MSMLALDNLFSTPSTTMLSLVATTQSAYAVPQPWTAYAAGLVFWGSLLASGVGLYVITRSRSRATTAPESPHVQGDPIFANAKAETPIGNDWAPPRTLLPIDGGKLWIGAVAMIWCFLALPLTAMQFLRPADASTTQATRLSDGAQVAVLLMTYLSGLLAVALLHGLWKVGSRPSLLLGLQFNRPRLALMTILAIWITVPLTMFVATLNGLLWQQMGWQRESAHELLQLMGRNETSPIVLGLTVLNAAVLAPVFEEVLFRGHLQTALGSVARSRWLAILSTSLIFAMIHPSWTRVPIFVLSVAIGYAYERTGSLWVAIAMHVAFNSISTCIYLAAQ